MIVIYTGDIRRNTVSQREHFGALTLEIEAAFLSELDSNRIYTCLYEKISRRELLSEEELMEFIVLPLSYSGKKKKKQKIREAVALAGQIGNKEQQLFALAGLLVFTDKVIDAETANQIRRMIDMTQVARIFEEEKQQAIAEAKKEAKKEAMKEAMKEANKKYEKERQQTARKMIKRGFSSEDIAFVVSGYSVEMVEQLRQEMGSIK